MLQTIGFDDWACDQDVRYELVAYVNDQVAYKIDEPDINTIIQEANHAEEAVAELMNDQYNDEVQSGVESLAEYF